MSTANDLDSGRTLKSVCKKLGFEIKPKDFIWQVAKKYKTLKTEGPVALADVTIGSKVRQQKVKKLVKELKKDVKP